MENNGGGATKRVLRGLAYAVLTLVAVTLSIFFVVLPAQVEKRINRVREPPPYRASPEAASLHARLLVADLHADSLLWGRDLLLRSDRGQVAIPRLRDGNVNFQLFAVVNK